MSAADNRVLIIGAGPVGLVSAVRLASMGIACVVFEASSALPQDLRASTFHPPTLDMLEPYGITDQLLEAGRICPSWQVRIHETHEKAEFDLSLISGETNHPYRLQCEQSKLCKFLEAAAIKSDLIELRYNSKLVDIEQHADHVTAIVAHAGDTQKIEGRILIGADGAKSQVRKLLGFAFEGVTYPETTILATTTFPFHDHLPGLSNVNYVWTEGGTFSLLRLPNLWRCSLYRDPDESVEDATQPDAVQKKMQRIVAHDADYDVLDLRVYRVHMRIVDTYASGRVALAGDAAHVNSPSGGMGMNGGIHDAFALTDEIQNIWDGAPLSRLQAYSDKRRPIAQTQILAQADKNRNRMQEKAPNKRRQMFTDLQQTAADPVLAKAHLMRSSMITGLRQAEEFA